MAATSAPVAAVEFEADSTLRWYEPDETVGYGFCATCGSSLFWRASADPGRLVICAGPLDQPTGLRTVAAWWMAEHGDYHTPEPGLEEHAYDG